MHLDSGIKMKPTTCFLLTGLTFTALTGVITGCDNKETDSGIDNNIETEVERVITNNLVLECFSNVNGKVKA